MNDTGKAAAARHAAEHAVAPGATVGLGSGSTALLFVAALGERIAAGLSIRGGIPTSRETERAALSAGIPLLSFEEILAGGETARLDVAVDGADEIDPEGRLLKGGGASLLREKIVARFAHRMVVIADETKRVDRLGAFPLPVEIVPFGAAATAVAVGAALALLVGRAVPVRLRERAGEPVVTDNGNWLLDCATGPMADPEAVADALGRLAGVVEHGLFLSEADAIVIGRADGTVAATERAR